MNAQQEIWRTSFEWSKTEKEMGIKIQKLNQEQFEEMWRKQ